MRTVALTVWLCLISVPLGAQVPVPALRTGVRVRVSHPRLHRDTWGQDAQDTLHTTGTLQYLSSDSVVVAQGGATTVVVPWSTVVGLDSARSCHKWGKSIAWGAGIGALAGAVTGALFLDDALNAYYEDDTTEDVTIEGVAIGAAGGLVLGIGVGAVVAAVSTSTCWDQVAP